MSTIFKHYTLPLKREVLRLTPDKHEQDRILSEGPMPKWCFLFLRETHKCYWCGGEGDREGGGGGGEGEHVNLKTHTTARGMGKNTQLNKCIFCVCFNNMVMSHFSPPMSAICFKQNNISNWFQTKQERISSAGPTVYSTV